MRSGNEPRVLGGIAIAHEQATRTVATAAVAFPPIRYVRAAATTTTGM